MYCSECAARQQASPDALYLAYRGISNLRAESKAYYEALDVRAEAAEKAIRENRAARGLR
jgi:hypothetical protein